MSERQTRGRLNSESLSSIVDGLPDDWLDAEADFATQHEHRAAYVRYLLERLNGPRAWLDEAAAARERGPKTLQRRLTHRVV
jgi:hypothetical protein